MTFKMKLFDADGANTMTVRLFALERSGLAFGVEHLDIATLENRKPAYLKVNPRGEVPALQLLDGTVITEITAIMEFFDEIASSGSSLFAATPEQRAETRMWLRRMDLEICQPVIAYYRNDPASVDFYRGHRLPCPEARLAGKISICQALNRLDDKLEGKTWLYGDRFSAADVLCYGLNKPMSYPVPFVLDASRKNIKAYFDRMDERTACKQSMTAFSHDVSLP